MNFVRVIVFVWFALTVSPVFADWIIDSLPAPNASNAKMNGKFGAQLILVDDVDTLLKAWDRPESGLKIRDIDTIGRDKRLSSFIIFSGSKPDRKGNSNVTAKYYVLNSKGKVVAKTKSLEVWRNKLVSKDMYLELSSEYMAIKLTDNFVPGVYTVRAVVFDANARLKIVLEKQFTLTEK